MVQVKTADLIGKQLDYAVAVAEGHPLCEECMYGADALIIGTGRGDLEPFSPSTDWSQGGPLLESLMATGKWQISHWHDPVSGETITISNTSDDCIPNNGNWEQIGICVGGSTILIAACRARAVEKFGVTISVPEEELE